MSVAKKCPQIGLQTINLPMVGFGTWLIPPGEVEEAMDSALEAGIRLIDAAYMYQNEAEIGAVLKKWLDSGKLKRSDLFVVTKLPLMALRAKDVEPYFNSSLKNLGLNYVDLYLIHTPVGIQNHEMTDLNQLYQGEKVKLDQDTDLVSVWRAMEALVDSGKARSIGVSNFNSEQVERISTVARIPIALIQVECHAYFQQKKLREAMHKLGVKIMTYATLGSPGRSVLPSMPIIPPVLTDPLVLKLAAKHSKTTAQILLCHQLQSGLIVIPKSINKERIKENFDIFNFNLTEEEMKEMDGLDKGSRARTFDFTFIKTDDDVTKLREFPYTATDAY